MRVFTVTKPEGTKDAEFEAYVRLLEEIGIDVSNAPRVAEPGTSRRWLHVWHSQPEAERFTRELRTRTRDQSWEMYSFDSDAEFEGPVAPLEIIAVPTVGGTEYRLHPKGQERILREYPNSRLVPQVFWSRETQHDYESTHGPIWNQVAILLTGLSEEQISKLGGYTIYVPGGEVLREAPESNPTYQQQ